MAVIDLSQLPAPQIVDVPDFETLLAERKAEFVALHPKDEQEAVIRTLELESEPVTKLLQENAYRELLLRQRINEAAQAVMVAYAIGGDLDQLAANYNVKRLTVTGSRAGNGSGKSQSAEVHCQPDEAWSGYSP